MDKDLCQKIREWVDAHEEAVISLSLIHISEPTRH